MGKNSKIAIAVLLIIAMLFAQGCSAVGSNTVYGSDKAAGESAEAAGGSGTKAGGKEAVEDEDTANDESAAEKEEVVYGVLTSEGGIKDVYIVNVFNISGNDRITDYGRYKSVKNLTTTEDIELLEDGVSFRTEEGRFYYQGDLAMPCLPWNISISYMLNGSRIDAEKLAGESGDLEIRVAVSKNESVDNVFFDNYMLQISLLLDAEKCTSISADGAVIANAGGNKQINFTVMPKTEKTYVLKAEVSDFEMKGMTIAGIPFSADIDAPDTGKFTGELVQLSNAIGQIDRGTSDLSKGIEALRDGADKLADGSDEFSRGMNRLSNGGEELVSGSRQIKDGLEQLNEGLSSVDLSGLDQLTGLTDKLEPIADALDEIADRMSFGPSDLGERLKDIINSIGMPDPPEYPEIPPWAFGNERLLAAYGKLIREYEKLDAVYSALCAAVDMLKGMVGLLPDDGGRQYCSDGIRSLSKTIRGFADMMGSGMGGFGQLQEGVDMLASNYGKFHDGLVEYTQGVSQAASGYSEINKGMSGLAGGIHDLNEGSSMLSDGTGRLARETSGMDKKLNKEVDKLIADYKGGDFDLVSFASPDNKGINSVQFVITTEGIEKKEVKLPGVRKKILTFWEKLMALFK